MNRYETTFNKLRKQKEMAFIPFAVAGDPDIKTSEAIFKTYIDSGADILEIGYPFSDPVADGPVNQRASQRAIASGMNHKKFFGLISSLRKYSDVPIGILMYANSAMHIGYNAFCRNASEAGIDSILLADMPPEEAPQMLESMHKYGLNSVFIVSELTLDTRIQSICSLTTGFVYVVSRLGTTGVQTDMDTHVKNTLKRLQKITDMPLCVGFGISKPEHVKMIKKAGADGAIVGSALVNIIEKDMKNRNAMLSILAERVSAFKKASV
jgi:tryptophan synthase alpha chain